MSDPDLTSPVNPIPPVVLALFIVILGVEVTVSLGAHGLAGGPTAVGWRLDALQRYAFSGEIFDWMVQTRRFPPEHLLRLVSYPFVHANFTQALFAGVMLLALGKFVGEVFAWWAVAIVFLGAGAGGALVWGLAFDDSGYLYGAFPGVYGLVGAFSFLMWLKLGQSGDNRMRAFTLIGFLMGIQVIFAILFGARTDWLADLAGFGWGFLLSFVVSPGGWARVRAKLRHG